MSKYAANDSLDQLLAAAIDAFERGDVDSIAFVLLRAGEVGLESPGEKLATALINLDGVSPALSKRAFSLLEDEERASGSATAAYALGAIYSTGGLGVEPNDSMALRYLLSAAERGMHEAELIVAIFFLQGIGGHHDVDASAHWFGRAARAGYLFAKSQVVKSDKSASHFKRWWLLTKIAVESLAIAMKDPTDSRLVFLNSKARLFRA